MLAGERNRRGQLAVERRDRPQLSSLFEQPTCNQLSGLRRLCRRVSGWLRRPLRWILTGWGCCRFTRLWRVEAERGADALCLGGGRFKLELDWRVPWTGKTGRGVAVPGTADTGFFWFFDAKNLELAVKVLDGRAINGHYWIFYGSLSNVEFTLRVTDKLTGAVKTYKGSSCGGADTTAF